MRATVLLVSLVVLVSIGEALECNTMDGGTEVCPPGNDDVCIHYIHEENEFKKCGPLGECERLEGDFTAAELEHALFRCCPADLCN
uniref:Plethodontid modulating factor n=1 Tax=Aneides ferreus TaxID=154578 RepID=Q0GAB8_9SALA|nr:plethodontid modulating factor [Aneides ferreus]